MSLDLWTRERLIKFPESSLEIALLEFFMIISQLHRPEREKVR